MEAAPSNRTSPPSSAGGVSYRRLLWAGPLAGIMAAAINAVIWLVARGVGAMPQDVIIPNSGTPLTLGPVVILSFVPALFAAVFLAVLGRFTRRAFAIFAVIAVIVLVLSFYTPFTIPGVPIGMVLALELMHVVAAVVVVAVFARFARR